MKHEDESDLFMAESTEMSLRQSGADTDTTLKQFTREEMDVMDHVSLVSHAWRMQKAYFEIERDSKFLAWEFNEYHDNVTFFSRAAQLAHNP